MIKSIVITDLTRFNTNEKVCIAGFDSNNLCIRPMRYLTQQEAKDLMVVPGTILRADFSPIPNPERPHKEDHFWKNPRNMGSVTSDDFLSLLERTNVGSIASGFGAVIEDGQKHIDIGLAGEITSSIITLEIPPGNLQLVRDLRDGTKIKVHIEDNSGFDMEYLSLTDLGYFLHFQGRDLGQALIEENHFIHSQERLFVRLGLGRVHKVEDRKGLFRNGFWVQVNGIYTFPDYNVDLRSY
eukprot:GDKJ01026927.1.p1 GENE.GDKJ01026927.1~~GDKJ01026927.1.p1  ORF type:complete len:240 (-),score=-10.84 GDKJ01026927.1:72-791(-)